MIRTDDPASPAVIGDPDDIGNSLDAAIRLSPFIGVFTPEEVIAMASRRPKFAS